LIEEIFGEILDKKNAEDQSIKKIGLFKYRISGRMPIDYFNEVFSVDINGEGAVTVGGYILNRLGAIPEINSEIFYGESLKIVIETVINNEIKNLRIEKAIEAPQQENSGENFKKQ